MYIVCVSTSYIYLRCYVGLYVCKYLHKYVSNSITIFVASKEAAIIRDKAYTYTIDRVATWTHATWAATTTTAAAAI